MKSIPVEPEYVCCVDSLLHVYGDAHGILCVDNIELYNLFCDDVSTCDVLLVSSLHEFYIPLQFMVIISLEGYEKIWGENLSLFGIHSLV